MKFLLFALPPNSKEKFSFLFLCYGGLFREVY